MTPKPAAPPMGSSWLVPLVFVILSLLLLAAVPLVTGRRVAAIRDQVSDFVDPARVAVNDLEEALADEVLALQWPRVQTSPDRVRGYAVLRVQAQADADTLATLVQPLGTVPIRQAAQLQSALSRWHSRRHPSVAVPLDSAGAADVADAQTAANALEETLEQLGSARREEVRRVERVDAIARAVLLPLALLSAVLVFVGGGRTIRLAREAERDRQALRHAVDALQEAVRTKAGLMRGVTHDLKNPLGAALGYADLLTDGVVGSLSEEQRRIVARIHHLVHVSLDTIRDLLDLARADAEELRVEPVPTDLAELVRDTAADYAASAAQAGLAIAVDVPTTEVVAATDPARVRQILGNLLSNAIKYGKGGGQVSLSLSRMSAPDSSGTAGVAIAVRDGGPGIASEYRERIFEEFFRVPERSGAADGAGVGLAISRRMARLLGGDLRLTSSDGSGSTFVLWVPEGPGTRD